MSKEVPLSTIVSHTPVATNATPSAKAAATTPATPTKPAVVTLKPVSCNWRWLLFFALTLVVPSILSLWLGFARKPWDSCHVPEGRSQTQAWFASSGCLDLLFLLLRRQYEIIFTRGAKLTMFQRVLVLLYYFRAIWWIVGCAVFDKYIHCIGSPFRVIGAITLAWEFLIWWPTVPFVSMCVLTYI